MILFFNYKKMRLLRLEGGDHKWEWNVLCFLHKDVLSIYSAINLCSVLISRIFPMQRFVMASYANVRSSLVEPAASASPDVNSHTFYLFNLLCLPN